MYCLTDVQGVNFHFNKACRMHIEVRRIRLDHCNTGIRLVEVWRVCFDHRKACRRLAELRRVPFDHRKACWKLLKVWIVRFDHHKSCRRLVVVQRVSFHHSKLYRGLVVPRIAVPFEHYPYSWLFVRNCLSRESLRKRVTSFPNLSVIYVVLFPNTVSWKPVTYGIRYFQTELQSAVLWRVRFDFGKACRRLTKVLRVCFTTEKRVGSL